MAGTTLVQHHRHCSPGRIYIGTDNKVMLCRAVRDTNTYANATPTPTLLRLLRPHQLQRNAYSYPDAWRDPRSVRMGAGSAQADGGPLWSGSNAVIRHLPQRNSDRTVPINGSYKDFIGLRGVNARYTYKVCDAGTTNCSQ